MSGGCITINNVVLGCTNPIGYAAVLFFDGTMPTGATYEITVNGNIMGSGPVPAGNPSVLPITEDLITGNYIVKIICSSIMFTTFSVAFGVPDVTILNISLGCDGVGYYAIVSYTGTVPYGSVYTLTRELDPPDVGVFPDGSSPAILPITSMVDGTFFLNINCTQYETTPFETELEIPANEINIQYDGSPYCVSLGGASPIITPAVLGGTTSYVGGVFIATPAGLVINSETGEIVLGLSEPGIYTVTLTYELCDGAIEPYVTSTNVEIISGPNIPFTPSEDSPWLECKTLNFNINTAATEYVLFIGGQIYSGTIPVFGEFSVSLDLNSGTYSGTLMMVDSITGCISSNSYDFNLTIPEGIFASFNSATYNCDGSIQLILDSVTTDGDSINLYIPDVTTMPNWHYFGTISFDAESGKYVSNLITTNPVPPPLGSNDFQFQVYSSLEFGPCPSDYINGSVFIFLSPPTLTLDLDPDSICPGGSTILNVSYSGSPPFTFDLSDGTQTSSIQSATNIYSVILGPLFENVTYTVSNVKSINCEIEDPQSIEVHVQEGNPTLTYPESVYCPSGETIPTFDPPGGTFSSIPTGLDLDVNTGVINLNNSDSGDYIITYTVTIDECETTATFNLKVEEIIPLNLSYPDGPICRNGRDVRATFSPLGGEFSSTPNGLVIDPSTGLIYADLSEAGNYTITYSYGNCSTVDTTVEVVNPVEISFSYGEGPFCPEGTLSPTELSPIGGTFTFSPAGLVIDPVTGTIDLEATPPGAYTVTYSVGECNEHERVRILIISPANIEISYGDGPFCPEGILFPTIVTPDCGVFSSPDLTIDPETGRVDVTGLAPGDYTITYTVTIYSCVYEDSITITIVPFPVLNNLQTDENCDGTVIITFVPEGDDYTYYLDDVQVFPTVTPEGYEITATYSPGQHYVIFTVRSPYCETKYELDITIGLNVTYVVPESVCNAITTLGIVVQEDYGDELTYSVEIDGVPVTSTYSNNVISVNILSITVGTHTISITATDDEGCTSTYETTFTIVECEQNIEICHTIKCNRIKICWTPYPYAIEYIITARRGIHTLPRVITQDLCVTFTLNDGVYIFSIMARTPQGIFTIDESYGPIQIRNDCC